MKFSSKLVAEHLEVPLADEGRFEQIIESWQDARLNTYVDTRGEVEQGNVCYVVCLASEHLASEYLNREKGGNLNGKMAEILGLLSTLGEPVVGQQQYYLHQPNPKTLLGSGKLQQVAHNAKHAGANMLVIDAKLTPSQTRNIEMQTGFAVCDREAIILNVFLRHAQTKAARIQVEIAQLQYLRPRIRGIGLNMDQQAGGIGASRGAGETASQLLARQLDNRLVQLQKSADKLSKASANQRKSRRGCRQAALVGYTNAGKTSLMNALTQAGLSAKDAPFETLDTTTRVLSTQPGRQLLLSDTVGFIRQLPQSLLASFESTLAQTREADLLVIVIDVSDPECALHLQTTLEVLSKLGTDDIEKLFVFNKVDKYIGEDLQGYCADVCKDVCGSNDFVMVSSLQPAKVLTLKQTITKKLTAAQQTAKVFVPHNATTALSKLYANCQIMDNEANEKGSLFTIQADKAMVAHIKLLAKEVA